jgi:nucleotide-binding universal stress UspA family protein
VPLDGSKNSLRGLRFALNIARQTESHIIGLNVVSFQLMKTSPTVIHTIKQKSKEIIKHAQITSQKKNVLFSGLSKVGSDIGKTIVTLAKNHNVDMIIIGSRGPDPELGLFLGSVTNYVVNKSKIPVTIVK